LGSGCGVCREPAFGLRPDREDDGKEQDEDTGPVEDAANERR
jgi:hypothetical protein